MKLIHISDLHLVANGRLFGLDPRQRFSLAIADINASHADADLVVISGDLTDSGEEKVYSILRSMLEDLRPPHVLMLGNHDNREAFSRVFVNAPLDGHGFVQQSIERDGVRLLLLDTLSDDGAGEMCERRLAWLAARLDENPDVPTYIFMHHPPFSIDFPMMDRHMLRRPEAFAQVVSGHANIRHLFFGHVHRPLAGSWRGIPISSLPSTNHQVALDLRDLPGISGHDGNGAYGVVFISPERTIAHLHDYMAERRHFDLDDVEAQYKS